MVRVAARLTPSADPSVAALAISEFGVDLFTSVRSISKEGDNVSVSPTSVAFAVGIVEPGAVGDAQPQFRKLLHIHDPATFHDSMNALERSLNERAPTLFSGEGSPGEVNVRIFNAAFLQYGYPFEADYLKTIGSHYGPVLHEVDFSADPDAIAHAINDAVAEATNDRITKLIADGAIDPFTVLALVDALYLRASWLTLFNKASTADQTFTALDGTEQTVRMMNGVGELSAVGDGWIGASKSYVGGLTAQFILPDAHRFEEIATDLGRVFTEFAENRSGQTRLGLPQFDLRFGVELDKALKALGLLAPYDDGALLDIANDPLLVIDQVIHQTSVAMDEAGSEAAAATDVLMMARSAPGATPAPVILDRPFLYRIIDDQTGATLFVGQVLNPLA